MQRGHLIGLMLLYHVTSSSFAVIAACTGLEFWYTLTHYIQCLEYLHHLCRINRSAVVQRPQRFCKAPISGGILVGGAPSIRRILWGHVTDTSSLLMEVNLYRCYCKPCEVWRSDLPTLIVHFARPCSNPFHSLLCKSRHLSDRVPRGWLRHEQALLGQRGVERIHGRRADSAVDPDRPKPTPGRRRPPAGWALAPGGWRGSACPRC